MLQTKLLSSRLKSLATLPIRKVKSLQQERSLKSRYSYYAGLADYVDNAVATIRNMEANSMFDLDYLEHVFIPQLGLNNEILCEQPPELSPHFGKGLHIWQYPNQLAPYLMHLTNIAKDITIYCEIGCRWGGMFILTSEWLQRSGAKLHQCIAIDPVMETPFITRYKQISKVPVTYVNAFSTDQTTMDYLQKQQPDCVFIDGDHSLRGVMHDYSLVRGFANVIIHHDIASTACPDTTQFWQYLKKTEDNFDKVEFVDQYPSVSSNYLGIGVMKRKIRD
jgi:hypothetical protein